MAAPMPPTPDTDGLAGLLKRVPGWQGADLKITPLSGGITNRNYRIDLARESFVLRRSGANTELLGIDRRVELAATKAAAAIGLAPEVIHFIEPEGCLVTRFIPGEMLSPAEMRRPDTIQQVAAALQLIHQLPPIPGAFSPFHVIIDYRRLADARGVSGYPADIDWLFERAREVEAAFAANPEPACPCHNDLLNENFLRDSETGRLRILDWEYAGMGDRYFDLANFAAQHEFGAAETRQLLQSYFGEATTVRQARLGLMRCLSDFREAMWGMLQSGISSLEFDFQGYAARYFSRLSSGFQNPSVHEWLAVLES